VGRRDEHAAVLDPAGADGLEQHVPWTSISCRGP
jgi:hypothetical protein